MTGKDEAKHEGEKRQRDRQEEEGAGCIFERSGAAIRGTGNRRGEREKERGDPLARASGARGFVREPTDDAAGS